ncbi:glutathione S-transferase family protein [Enterovirga sp.]|uniref:glutathione S-transferase family protein n=1 Tax=Enterovirga sp. TaxID=2026350 RepID=UPI002BA9CE5A|nr:glutathione S-transferase family protein [Enterovirga sp.]HMO30552.1 glutathione S-transferase family protein [Enterovirga sp.]
MKLYDGGRAPNPRRVRIFLAEKGISVPLVPVDIMKGEHKTPAFTSLNPMQRIPSLVLDDGTVISESIAICRYFEALQPEPALFGRGPAGCALVEMWQRRMELDLLLAVAAVFRHTHPSMVTLEAQQVAEWGEANRSRVASFLTFLDGHLEGREFVAGDEFSVADITGLVAVDFMRLPRIPVPEGLANVKRWHGALAARPSAKA